MRTCYINPRLIEVKFKLNAQLILGDHYICDLSNCDRELLYQPERANQQFISAVRQSGLTIIDEGFYKFNPHGFTCFLLLAESHASLHAWPEHGYCAIDLFTCAQNLDINPLIAQLQALLGAEHCNVRKIHRVSGLHETAWVR